MPYNGAGVFTRTFDCTNDRDAGTNILASKMDTELDGIASGLSNCLTRDGQSPPTANIPMGGYKLTGLGAPTNDGDAVNKLWALTTSWTVTISATGGNFPGSNTLQVLRGGVNSQSPNGAGVGVAFTNNVGGNARTAGFFGSNGNAQIWVQNPNAGAEYLLAAAFSYGLNTFFSPSIAVGSGNFSGSTSLHGLTIFENPVATSGAGMGIRFANYTSAGARRLGSVFAIDGTLQFWAQNGGSGADKLGLIVGHDGSANALVAPGADGGSNLGSGSLRFGTVYATSGTINTSDRRRKKDIGQIPEELLRAARRVRPRMFRWDDEAIQDERWQIGYVAQDWIEALEAEGLDWRKLNIVADNGPEAPLGLNYAAAEVLLRAAIVNP